MSYNSQYQTLTSNSSPTVNDNLYYDLNGTETATDFYLKEVSSTYLKYARFKSNWSNAQQKQRGIGFEISTGTWTEDPWSLSNDLEPDLVSNDGTFASAGATCADAHTISIWNTAGSPYEEGSFISPTFVSTGGGTSTHGSVSPSGS